MIGIKIKTNGPETRSVRVTDESGNEIKYITRISVTMEPNDLVRAELSLIVSEIDIDAVGILSLQSTKDAADAYGYDLVKRA